MMNILVSVVLLFLLPPGSGTRTIFSPDRKSKIRISDHSKRHAGTESAIRIASARGTVFFDTTFVSADGEHGFGVVKVSWTDDSRFLAIALTSSGGHQPWHVPTFVYSIEQKRLISLDRKVGQVTSVFTLLPPDSIVFSAFTTNINETKEVRVSLSALVQ